MHDSVTASSGSYHLPQVTHLNFTVVHARSLRFRQVAVDADDVVAIRYQRGAHSAAEASIASRHQDLHDTLLVPDAGRLARLGVTSFDDGERWAGAPTRHHLTVW